MNRTRDDAQGIAELGLGVKLLGQPGIEVRLQLVAEQELVNGVVKDVASLLPGGVSHLRVDSSDNEQCYGFDIIVHGVGLVSCGR